VFLNAIGRPYTASGLRKVWQAEGLREGQGALYQLLQRYAPFYSVSGTQCRGFAGPDIGGARPQ
jgi:hypothetical protein